MEPDQRDLVSLLMIFQNTSQRCCSAGLQINYDYLSAKGHSHGNIQSEVGIMTHDDDAADEV